MEDVIFYLMVAGAVIVNIVRNYQKASKENKERDISKPVVIPPVKTSKEKVSKHTDIPKKKSGYDFTGRQETITEKYPSQLPESFLNTNYESLESLDSLESYNFEDADQTFSSLRDENRISEIEEIVLESPDLDLQLNTREDLRRAFVHSLIFDRKY